MNSEEIYFDEILDYFRLGLRLGVVSKKEMIAWVDKHLLNDTLKERQHILVELSLVQKDSIKTISAFISDVIGIKSTLLGCRLLLGRLGRAKNIEELIPKLGCVLETMPLFEIEIEQMEIICFDFDADQLYFSFSEEDFEVAKVKAVRFFQLYDEYKIKNLHELEEKEKKLLDHLYGISNIR